MESGLVVSFKQWKYPEDAKNQNSALDVLVSVIQVKIVFVLDGCKVHHRLLHRQAVHKKSTVYKT